MDRSSSLSSQKNNIFTLHQDKISQMIKVIECILLNLSYQVLLTMASQIDHKNNSKEDSFDYPLLYKLVNLYGDDYKKRSIRK